MRSGLFGLVLALGSAELALATESTTELERSPVKKGYGKRIIGGVKKSLKFILFECLIFSNTED